MDRSALDHMNCKVLSEDEGGFLVRYSTPAVEALEALTMRTRKQGNPEPEQPTYRGILVKHLRPIWTPKDLGQFKKAFRDIMLSHHMIHISISRTLHCGIDFHNLMVHYGDGNTVHGALIDFDLASLEEPTCEYHHERRTKARRFIPRELVKSPTPNFERFDWESFYYVLCWIGTHYSEGAEIRTIPLHFWNARDDDVLVQCKSAILDGSIMAGSMTPSFITLFTDFYIPVYQSWIEPMQEMFQAADRARSKSCVRKCHNDETLGFDEETVDGLITWERIWDIIRN